MVLNYAECFNVYYCTDGYKLLDVKDGAQYLLVPDGKEAPDDLDSDVIVIHQPLERIYMAATSPMALFDAIDSLDTIRLSGETADNWYVQDAVDAMNAGTMIFAGQFAVQSWHAVHLAANRSASPAPGGRIRNRFAYSASLPMPVFASTIPAATPATSTPPLIRNARRA